MIVLLLLAQIATPVPEATPPVDEDIVVVGRRLSGWKGKARDTFGIKSCRTTQSTGDPEIDRIGCRVLIDCLSANKRDMFAASKAAGRDPEKRRLAMAPVNARLSACFKERRESLVAELVAQRRGKGG